MHPDEPCQGDHRKLVRFAFDTGLCIRQVLEAVDSGLLADFGNWGDDAKYDNLAAILPLAESCHAKCSFNADGQPNSEDYVHCLDLARAANYRGPYSLIYDGIGADEWTGLAIEHKMVQP